MTESSSGPVNLSVRQLQVLFLQAIGMWTRKPLSPIHGVYLGHEVYVTARRWKALHADPVTIEMAEQAKKAL